MKLYDVPRNSKIKVVDYEQVVPPASKAIIHNETLLFKNIDGMYSYCIDKDGDIVHLAAWTEVEIVE